MWTVFATVSVVVTVFWTVNFAFSFWGSIIVRYLFIICWLFNFESKKYILLDGSLWAVDLLSVYFLPVLFFFFSNDNFGLCYFHMESIVVTCVS